MSTDTTTPTTPAAQVADRTTGHRIPDDPGYAARVGLQYADYQRAAEVAEAQNRISELEQQVAAQQELLAIAEAKARGASARVAAEYVNGWRSAVAFVDAEGARWAGGATAEVRTFAAQVVQRARVRVVEEMQSAVPARSDIRHDVPGTAVPA